MSEAIQVIILKDDAILFVAGALEGAIKKQTGEISHDASVMRMKQMIARQLQNEENK